jgi:hydroxymethylglutaryl-CoA synthase
MSWVEETSMRGIISAAGYLPHWRLQRGAVTEVLGTSAGKGTRTVASYDEDGLTMAVDAGRRALADAPASRPAALWFATTSPTYAEKTNATIAHAALRLDGDVIAADAGAGLRGTSAFHRAGGAGARRRHSHGHGRIDRREGRW